MFGLSAKVLSFYLATLVASASLLVGSASAQTTYQLVVNPIQVCDDAGVTCANANRELFLAETDKIWAQAGLDIMFLDWKVMYDTASLDTNVSLGAIANAANNEAISGVTNMWFVVSTDSNAYGWGNPVDGGRVLISDDVFTYMGAGRRDTIAHELGHTLGLPHIDGHFPLNLMEEGGVRSPATNISQIYPDGQMRDQLFQDQIDTVLNSSHVDVLAFSIPGDATLDGQVLTGTPDPADDDVLAFIAGWLHVQQDPDINSWMKGDFDLDGATTLADAFILHQALVANGQGAFDFSLLGQQVPEPRTLALGLFALAGMAFSRRRTRTP